jgi:hypothetical protein
MIYCHLHDLVCKREYTAALEFLNSCDDEVAAKQLTKQFYIVDEICYVPSNALMEAAYKAGAPEELIRMMIKRGPDNYINEKDRVGYTAANNAIWRANVITLELLLTLGADPKGCRSQALRYSREACIAVLDRFEQRTTLACCLCYYDELHQTTPLILHADIAALSPFATILHDLHGINGDMHSISRIILSFI